MLVRVTSWAKIARKVPIMTAEMKTSFISRKPMRGSHLRRTLAMTKLAALPRRIRQSPRMQKAMERREASCVLL